MHNRREMIARSVAVGAALASAGLLPAHAQAGWNKAAFEAKSMEDALKALGTAKPVESAEITLTAPDIAENGAVVPIGASTTLPSVKQIVFFVEKNPTPMAGSFTFTDAVEPNVATRVKMAQTSNVFAVALTQDGRTLFARKEVKVTLGGCGG